MAKIGDMVVLKSGGPEMEITYIIKGGEGSRDKAASMKGYGKGDVVAEYEEQLADGQMRKRIQTFKAATLQTLDGTPLSGGGGGGGGSKRKDDDDDDDDDW